MPNIQVKNVPEQAHAVLRARAAQAGQSLQEYLLSRIVAETSCPTVQEIFDRAATRPGPGFGFTDAVEALEAERAGR